MCQNEWENQKTFWKLYDNWHEIVTE
jgi:hypothetical protein